MNTYTIGEHTVNLSAAFPFTVRDMMQLEKMGIATGVGVETQSMEQVVKLVTYIVGKANKDVSEDDILDLPMTQLNKIFEEFGKHLGSREDGLADPT